MNYIFVLQVDNSPCIRALIDPDKGLKAYMDHIYSRIPEGLSDPYLELSSDNGSYDCYYDGAFVASLTKVKVED
jgi:hypothetical protein